jgi:hypothetical protein
MSWHTEAPTGYCPHGNVACTGNPDQGIAPCLPGDHHYCGHGYDAAMATKDGQPRCPHCRGVTRRQRNPETYRRWRDTAQPALNEEHP